MVRLRRGLDIADSISARVLRQMCRDYEIVTGCEIGEQLAYAYAALVEDGERVVDQVGDADVRLRAASRLR